MSRSSPRPAAEPAAVVVLAPDEELAERARTALAGADVAATEVRIGTATGELSNTPLVVLAHRVEDLDEDALCGPRDRDFVLADDVERQLALRVRLLAERCCRRRERHEDAEELRAAAMQLAGEVHAADSTDGAVGAVVQGVERLFDAAAAAVVLFGEDAGPHGRAGQEATGWTTTGPLEPPVAAAFSTGLGRAIADAWAEGADLVVAAGDAAAPAVEELLGTSILRTHVIPIATRDELVGALLIGDGAEPSRRTAFERALFGYLGEHLAHATLELRLVAAERAARAELQETSDRLQRLVAEMNDLGVIVRSIADAVNVGVLYYDTDNKPQLHNRMVERFLELTGFDPKTGQSEHVYASDRRTRVKQDKNIVSETLEGDQRGLIFWIGDPDGEQRAIVTEAHQISAPDGRRLGSAVVTYDITDLANAIEIREEYLATVSHELRTPLTSIVGYLDLIEDGYDIDALGFGSEFRIIQRSAEQMLALIKDLLSTSTQELNLRVEPADLSALVAQSVKAFEPVADQHGHRVELELPATAVLGHVDAGRVKQVLDNLISNAAKYTPSGGVIRVRLEKDGETAVLHVADTGRGISKSDQARLFDRFFRARDVRDAAIQGVGIGLTIVKAIIDAHGGSIEVDSEAGQGSDFIVRLPLRTEASPLPTFATQP